MKDLRNIATDAQRMAKENPDTFEVPTQEQLDDLVLGQFVKINVMQERFWVEITNIRGVKIQGTINNDLIFTDKHDLRNEDPVEFNKTQIHQIYE